MGKNVQPAHDLRGVATMLPQLMGATMSATSQAGARPGGLSPLGASSMALSASGELDGEIDGITVEAFAAGGPGVATVRWWYTGDEDPRSWDPPVALAGWEFIDRTTTAGEYGSPHAVRHPDTGRVYVIATETSSSIIVWRQGARGLWTSSSVVSTGSDTVGTLVVLPDGDILALCTYAVGGALTQVRVYRSADDGDTWDLDTARALPEPIAVASSDVLRLRAAYARGQVLLLAYHQDADDVVSQYVSTDDGATFAHVEDLDDLAWPDIATFAGDLYVAYLTYRGGGVYPSCRTLTSAAQPLSSVEAIAAEALAGSETWGSYSAGEITGGELAIAADDDGVLWLYGRDHDANEGDILTRLSLDLNKDWTSNGEDTHNAIGTVVHWTGDASTYMRALTVAPERGRMVLVHQMAATATHDDSLCAAYLGGWSTVGMQEDDGFPGRTGHQGWEVVWLPLDEPDVTGTTWTVTSSGTATLGAYGLVVGATAGNTQSYRAGPTVTPAEDGIVAEFHVAVGSGTFRHQVRISDGTNDYTCRVEATATTLTMTDGNGAYNTAVSVDVASGVAIRIALDKGSGAWSTNVGRARAWYRVDGPATGAVVLYGPRPDRAWTQIGSSTTFASGGNTAANIVFGVVGSVGTSSATYRMVAYSTGAYTVGNVTTRERGKTRGRTVPAPVSSVHIVDGLRVAAERGPARAGDLWTHEVAYDYPVTALDPSRSPSPSQEWRSTTDATDADVTWSGVDVGWRLGDPLVIHLRGANFETATLYRDSSGTNAVAEMSLKLADLAFTRSRDTLYPYPGGDGAPFFLHEGQLAGCYVDFGGGKVRKIRTNSAGAWLASGAPGSYPSARIVLAEWDAADPAGGTGATFVLRMASGTFIVEGMQSAENMMLRIDAQDTAEGYFRLATCLIGKLHVFHQWSRGRGCLFTPLHELTTLPSGRRAARGRATMRRAVEVSWDDGIVTRNLHGTTAPNWTTLGYAGADALWAQSATPRTLAGLVRASDGATLPVALVHAIKQFSAAVTSSAPYAELHPEGVLYGRIVTESLRVDASSQAGGAEMTDTGELVTITRVVVEEEV
jgi:hypothetical protein